MSIDNGSTSDKLKIPILVQKSVIKKKTIKRKEEKKKSNACTNCNVHNEWTEAIMHTKKAGNPFKINSRLPQVMALIYKNNSPMKLL